MSAETTVFSVRMDASVKDSLDEFCAAVGMNANTAINMFARVVARDKRLPFDVAIEPFYDERNIKHLGKVKTDLESGAAKLTENGYTPEFEAELVAEAERAYAAVANGAKTYKNAAELRKALDAEDDDE